MKLHTSGHQLLSLIALSGELSPTVLSRLHISSSYIQKLITSLKKDKLIKTCYRDKLKGYRLTKKGKYLLRTLYPDRFLFYLTGCSDTNQPRSELPRRLRLHQTSRLYVLLQNADITFYRDVKPLVFSPAYIPKSSSLSDSPIFYHSREVKELGAETIKVNNSRALGILCTASVIYPIYYTGESLMKWQYNTDLRLKALLSYHTSQGVLSAWYPAIVPIHAIVIGTDMETALKLLNSTGGFQKSYFYLDTSFDAFYYIPDSPEGETLLKLLVQPALYEAFKNLLLSDLTLPDSSTEHYCDGLQDKIPVLLAFDFEMLRITHFITALSLRNQTGIIICFDFQADVLNKFCGEKITIHTINLTKFERRYFYQSEQSKTENP